MLSYGLVTTVVNYRKFCCAVLKSRARLFTRNDLWSRFKYLHLWYSRFTPKHVANLPLKPSLAVLFLQWPFVFLSK